MLDGESGRCEAPRPAADGPIDLTAWARTAAPRDASSLSAYLIALALIAIGGEWVYWRRLRWRT